MSKPYFLSALGIVNALGLGVNEVSAKLFAGDTSGLVLEEGLLLDGAVCVGRVNSVLTAVPSRLAKHNCRNNQLLLTALAQIEVAVEKVIARYGQSRIGVVVGSSTAGMAEAEVAFKEKYTKRTLPKQYDYRQQEIGAPAIFLATYLGVSGPAYTVSTACTSSAKAFESARNLLQHGICDAVVVGGADSLCKTTVNGFASLESIAPELNNPLSVNRKGINIGEGAALFLMSKDEAEVALLGVGESSDAYHMSAPHPEGLGAQKAMEMALQDASLSAEEVGYLNLHATATRKNDAMESKAVNRVFTKGVNASGTKPLTGHTLGAAGATELAFCNMAILANKLPPHQWDGIADPELPSLQLVQIGQSFSTKQRICMSNSFAFGGSNASLIIGAV